MIIKTSSILALALVVAACNPPAEPPPPAESKPAEPRPTAPTPASQPAAQTPPTAQAAPSAAPAKPPVKVTSVEGITEYRLDNGMRVLLFPEASKPTIAVTVTYMVGSRMEGYGETGMAHLLEHMMFKGTPAHPKVWDELTEKGAFFNASTSYDRTNYFEIFPASDENLDWAIGLEADRMVHSNIANSDLQSEFSVVRNEFENDENSPERILEERILSTAYLWHNYGKSTIGSRSDIERVPIENLQAFYKKFYQPDDALIIVAGKIDPDKTLALINQKFGAIPRPARALPTGYTEEPVQDGERSVTLRRTGDVQIVGVGYHIMAGPDPDFIAMDAISDIMTSEPSGRLYKALVATGMASRVSADLTPMAEPGMILFFAEVPADKPIEPVKQKLLAIVKGMGDPKNKPTAEEIDRYKATNARNFQLEMADNQRLSVGLSEWQAQGDWRLFFIDRDRVEKIDADQVQKVAAAYLKASNRTVGEFLPTPAPERAPLPARPDVVAMTKDYAGRAATSAGEAFEATPENIEKHVVRSEIGGVKLALLQKQTRGKAVHVAIILHYGSEKDLKGRRDAEDMISDMLMRGTTKHSYQQIKDELDKLKSKVNITTGAGPIPIPLPGVLNVDITSDRDNLAATMALVDELLKTSTFAADQFEIVKKEDLTSLQASLNQPYALLIIDGLRKSFDYPAGDVRHIPSIPEAIENLKAVKADDVKKVYTDLVGASYADIAVVGDFDADAVKADIEKYFGAWKSPRPYERVDFPFTKVKPGEEIIDTADKEGSLIGAIENFEMRDDDPDYPALVIANYVLGNPSASRMLNRLRQKEGWSYATATIVQAMTLSKRGMFGGFALVAPQNAKKAMDAFVEETRKFVAEGPTEDELAKAKTGFLQQYKTQLAQDEGLTKTLASYLFIGRTLDFDAKRNDAIGKLTVADIKKVLAKKYIDPDGLATIIAADQKKAKAAAAASAPASLPAQ